MSDSSDSFDSTDRKDSLTLPPRPGGGFRNDLDFLQVLLQSKRSSLQGGRLRAYNEALREAFLRVGSQTDDNLSCANIIEYGPTKVDKRRKKVRCLKIRGKNISLSDILASTEGMQLPATVERDFPDLTKDEWDAAMRMTVIILLVLEQGWWDEDG